MLKLHCESVCTLLTNLGGQNIVLTCCVCHHLHILMKHMSSLVTPPLACGVTCRCVTTLWHRRSHVALFPAFPHLHKHVFMPVTRSCWDVFATAVNHPSCDAEKRQLKVISVKTSENGESGDLPIFDQKRDVILKDVGSFHSAFWIVFRHRHLTHPPLASSNKSHYKATSPLHLRSVTGVLQFGHARGSFSFG